MLGTHKALGLRVSISEEPEKIEDANDHRLQRLLGKKYGEDQIFHPEPTVQLPLGFT